MFWLRASAFLASLSAITALPYDSDEAAYNLNQNQSATVAQNYWGEWENHTYHPSPSNWRFPFYVLTIDRYVDGDPTNNEANGTLFEHNWMSNQFRFGGDLKGLQNDLDYIQGMGIKGLYLTGSPFINMPWSGDGYGPLDFTLLDRHHGEIQDWQNLITEIHSRDMYVILDNTLATMGDLLAFKQYENASAPFSWHEYDYMWKSGRQYVDFTPGDAQNTSCQFPTFYGEDGVVLSNITELTECRASDFDQYGDIKGVGAYPSWQSQLSKFASVQDRLRAWPGSSVLDKINLMSCIQIAMLDIDGFRIDKALQTTVDAMAEFSVYQRECARDRGKENFLIVGESVGEIPMTSIFIGRGKLPSQVFANSTEAMTASNLTSDDEYVREFGSSALDGQAFHYPTYGAMTRFLGLDGPIGFEGVDFVYHWDNMLTTDDMVNANTGVFDPRHMFGMTNQDIFRWPSLEMGTQRQLLGMFITTLEMPGIPMLMYGEEQEYYVLENLASDYVYGRTPMASSRAWQLHGCYNLSEEVYVDMPFNSSANACHDDSVSLDHRDPSHPLRNILKRMYEMRLQFPVLNDGYTLQTLSTQLHNVYLPGSDGLPSPTGLWSVYRGRAEGIQDFAGTGQGNQGAWFVFHNENRTIDYTFDCANESLALISAFPANTTVKGLFYPYEEFTLGASSVTYGLEGSSELNGCFPTNLTMAPWEYKAFVPKSNWSTPAPTITRFVPGHDARLQSAVNINETETVDIEIRFSSEMDCKSVNDSLEITSKAFAGQIAQLNSSSVSCENATADLPQYIGGVATAWIFRAQLFNVSNGVHVVTVNNASTANGGLFTNARDHFKFRIGQHSNPMVFPTFGNYSYDLLHSDESGGLYISPMAPGADKFRYSLNWGSSWSNWTDYTDANTTLVPQPWSGTKLQEWSGEHVIVNYWSEITGSSDHIQHGDLDRGDLPPRRWPHLFAQGPWNQYGYDGGLKTAVKLADDGLWKFNLMAEWPNKLVLNVWGMNPDGYPDKTQSLGDVDGDKVLDWLPPDTLSLNVINISKPAMPYLGVTIVANDGNYNYHVVPAGSVWNQLILAIVLVCAPVLSAAAAIFVFRKSFYRVKFNEVGITEKSSWNGTLIRLTEKDYWNETFTNLTKKADENPDAAVPAPSSALAIDTGAPGRRTVLVATMEYEIEDWNIKIKIGGLGVMASLMGKNLGHQDLIWVVPCVGDVTYPVDQPGDIINVTILGNPYEIEVQYHTVRNITYVLLDAPIFRKQTRAEPYPARMDDLDSAVYYSAWNTCIAKIMVQFNVDIYHINDYHGAIAPLHLLPRTIPVCLSLHNAEFQGLWPLRTPKELDEICKVFNLEKSIVQKYVQFGDVFNLLHAAASYLRIHQNGFGAVGVSKKYGKRSFARYPIFWGLKNVGSLPNPDPSDTAEWSGSLPKMEDVVIDEAYEAERGNLRRQAQKWAGIEEDPDAELFVFVGRWSQQKGIDLIADVFFSVLEENPRVQLICVGPVIDLYGKFAALKLSKMMEKYPKRVFTKPEFTALPPYIFSGAEFALIPSRDEPFGLVAVEFGRKGALGVGSRVGGLGNMPGWWFTVESITTKHLLAQLKNAVRSALASNKTVRATMRHRSSLQRFPVAQWVEDLEKLQASSIDIHKTNASRRTGIFPKKSAVPTTDLPVNAQLNLSYPGSIISTPIHSLPNSVPPSISEGQEYQAVTRQQFNSPLATPIESTRPTPINTVPSTPTTSNVENPFEHPSLGSRTGSLLSLHAVAGSQTTFGLQQVDPSFTDSNSLFYNTFEKMLNGIDGKTSEDKYCIEKFLVQSEKRWFGQRHNAKLGRSRTSTPASSIFRMPISGRSGDEDSTRGDSSSVNYEDFLLGDDYVPPTGIKKLFQRKIGDWQIYSFLLAFGQIIAANSYQITLLTGENGQAASKLYAVASIYLAASVFWWIIYRKFASFYVLSLPFIFYGLAFFLLGMGPYVQNTGGRGWLYNVATGLYSVASASGSFFFALNFGDEGGAPVESWVLRACIIQGTQQIYVAALWYWGSAQTKLTSEGVGSASGTLSSPVATAITTPIAVLMWCVGLALFFGLPKYYRQSPGRVPSFYTSLMRRKIVLWFFVMVILQNYWLSAPYGRNWQYLWSSSHVPTWGIFLLVVVFFIGVWALMLWILGSLTRTHGWILPIFAIGLGFPRWCQMLWGTSNIGLYVPWGGDVVGALLGRSLWAWLGVLDAIQGVGFGMILLQTLTRVHIACALVAAQVIGSVATMVGRATSPTKMGPGDVFPDFSFGAGDNLNKVSFWLALACQGVICVGFFAFFRKEQLSKP